MSKWRKAVQALFLVVFIALIAAGNNQVWLGLFLLGVLLAMFVGRIYCGWICPINTVIELIIRITKEVGIKRLGVPEVIKKPVFRYGMLAAFIAVMFLVLVSGKKIPVFALLLLLGMGLSIFYHEGLWHRYLCPYGTILTAASSLTKHSLKIDPELCKACGRCTKVCPGEAVIRCETYLIDKGLCLQCLECITNCPRKAIHY